MKESLAPETINVHQELRALKTGEWVTEDNKLTSKANIIVDQVESFFRVQKKKTSFQLMGTEFGDNIEKYIQLFPNIKLPTGKRARSDKKNLETNFRWFFENHEYSWDIILKATAAYVDEFERKNYMYMRTSQYFIRKMEQDKTVTSDLADYCASVSSGEDLGLDNHFSEKVF